MAIAAETRDRITAHEFALKELGHQIFGSDASRASKRAAFVEELSAIGETEARLLATQPEDILFYGEDGEVQGYYEVLELIARAKVEVLVQINAIDSAQEKTDSRRRTAAERILESD